MEEDAKEKLKKLQESIDDLMEKSKEYTITDRNRYVEAWEDYDEET
jgi:hypothetical protein